MVCAACGARQDEDGAAGADRQALQLHRRPSELPGAGCRSSRQRRSRRWRHAQGQPDRLPPSPEAIKYDMPVKVVQGQPGRRTRTARPTSPTSSPPPTETARQEPPAEDRRSCRRNRYRLGPAGSPTWTPCSTWRPGRGFFMAPMDAGLTIQDMQALYCGNLGEAGAMVGQRVLREIGQTGIPVVNCANACATTPTAFREGEGDQGRALRCRPGGWRRADGQGAFGRRRRRIGIPLRLAVSTMPSVLPTSASSTPANTARRSSSSPGFR